MSHHQTLLLERDAELELLRTALARAVAGSGSTVLIEGAAGCGKSRLLSVALELAGNLGMRVLTAQGGRLEGDHPYGVVRQLFDPLLLNDPVGQPSSRLVGETSPARVVLGGSVSPSSGSAAVAAGWGAMNAIQKLTVAVAKDRPLLLMIDDAHWADASSLRALDFLGRRLADQSAVLCVTARPDEPGAPEHLLDELRRAAHPGHVMLGPLHLESVEQLVRTRHPQASSQTCAACHTVTAGNPFYLQELLRVVGPDDAAPSAVQILSIAVPSLADRVMRRVARVGAGAPALVRAMAVLGDGARLETAAALAMTPPPQAVQIAHQLRRLGVLAREDPPGFVHALLRTSIYDAMPEPDRQSAHRRAAQLLEESGAPTEFVAGQLRVLAPCADATVATVLLAAGEQAMDRAAVDEAVDLFQRAVAEGAAGPPRSLLLTRLGMARAVQRDPEAIADLSEAHQLTEEPRARAGIALTLAQLLAHTGQWQRSIAMIESIESELDPSESELVTEVAALQVAVSLFDPSRVADFDARRDVYLALSRGDHWASLAIASLLAAEAANRGRTNEAEALAERALDGGRLLAARGAGAWTAPHVITAFVAADNLERASEIIEQVRAAAEADGSAVGQFTAYSYRGLVCARRGDLPAAEADLLQTMRLADESGLMMGMTTAAFLFSDVLVERDGLAAVKDLVRHAELSPDFLETASGAMLLEVRGRLSWLERDHSGAVTDLTTAGDVFARLGFGPTFSTWRSSLAVALAGTDATRARRLAEGELELARSTKRVRPTAIALRALGVLSERKVGLDLLRQSTELLATSSARLEHARSLVSYGAALRRANHRSDARMVLVQAVQLANACGAHRLTRHAQQELRAAGSRRSRIATAGTDALTASEQRVVGLAATGASNPQIAAELFITTKTVETHLSHAYAKLGLTGRGARAQLAAILERSDGSHDATSQSPPQSG